MEEKVESLFEVVVFERLLCSTIHVADVSYFH